MCDEKGSYRNWCPRHEVYARLFWYDFVPLLDLLQKTRKLELNSTPEEYQAILTEFKEMNVNAPFARNIRFDLDPKQEKYYICEDFQNLRSYLLKIKTGLGAEEQTVQTFTELQEAVHAIYDALNSEQYQFFFDRETFEAFFSLRWSCRS